MAFSTKMRGVCNIRNELRGFLEGSKGQPSSRFSNDPAVMNYNFPQTMLMIIKALIDLPLFRVESQVIEIKYVNFSMRRSRVKKRGSNLKVSLQKLLKTHVEKMSTFGSVQKLLKTKQVMVFLRLY
jgi:hypothetical protein